MYKQFLHRGYPDKWLKQAIEKVKSTSVKSQSKTSQTPLYMCCTTFTVHSQAIKSIINKHWHVLRVDDIGDRIFKEPPLFSYYRGRNIRDHLVSSVPANKPEVAFRAAQRRAP